MPRDAFLQRVRQAVRAGNRPGHGAAIEPRGRVGYQGAGTDPAVRFRDEFIAAGGRFHPAANQEAAAELVLRLVQEKNAQRLLVGRGRVIDSLGLPEKLAGRTAELTIADAVPPEESRERFFAADLSITGVDFLIAETGTLVVQSRPQEPRSLSLLPPVHIAVADRSQLVPDLFDLFEKLDGSRLSSCLTLITGPSKTGDIELRLVTGVHGPGEVYLILIDHLTPGVGEG